MRIQEGRGCLLRRGLDTPFAGWLGASQVDAMVPLESVPWRALEELAGLAGLLPGGLALLWDLPAEATERLPKAFWNLLVHLPGLTLHVREEALAEHLEGPGQAWYHAAEPPQGAMGLAWRQGWIGWVPAVPGQWALPGLGKVEQGAEQAPPAGCLWGELVLPVGALREVKGEELAPMLADAQATLERSLSLRLSAKAWPALLPFQRRRTAWRLSLVGGREFLAAGGSWPEAAPRLASLASELEERLKCPFFLGSCHDPEAASLLGHQAMREGHPWRYSLPLPPASPTFTPGLAADPREPAPLEFRAAFPAPLVPLLSHPPVALLRVPHVPQESAVLAFQRGLDPMPAIRWLPPEMSPPGPYLQERSWTPISAFPALADVTQALQPSLFEDLGAGDAED